MPDRLGKRVTRAPKSLKPLGSVALSLWCAFAAFGAYFCMYAFRKPFTAATYDGVTLAGLDYKTVLVTAQVLGYTLSKFIGIKVIAEMRPPQRIRTFLLLIGLAELALLLFGLVPPPYNFVCLFLNGLPLGMVFGIVLGFLEGRQQTEILTASLCTSFIVADGVVKSVGGALLEQGVSVYWMPFLTGLIFLLPLLGFIAMLSRIPAPTAADIAARTERVPMESEDRWAFFRRYAVGIVLITIVYLLVTVLRSVRADFAPEIWRGLGVSKQPGVYAQSELWVGLIVLLVTGSMVLIRNNRRAFFAGLGLAFVGTLLLGAALIGLRLNALSPLAFMVSLGLGLYFPYVIVQTALFERLLAMTRDKGNVGYLIYLVDSWGYLGYVAVMFAKNLFAPKGEFLGFFLMLSTGVGVLCAICLIPCAVYFARHTATKTAHVLTLEGQKP